MMTLDSPEVQQEMAREYDRWIAMLAKSPYRQVDKAYEWCRRNLDANGNLIKRARRGRRG